VRGTGRAALGLAPLIVEKQPLVGWLDRLLRRCWWVPNNPVMKRAGVSDSAERARQYLDAACTYDGPGTTPARRDAFIRTRPRMVEFLENAGMKFVSPTAGPTTTTTCRAASRAGARCSAELFDTRELGEWESRLSRYKGFSLPVPSDQFADLMLVKRTMKGKHAPLHWLWRLLRAKLTGERLAAQARRFRAHAADRLA
jgi:3-oxosteroid 1-dehydrogenase